ncbi:tetratricopeptide repeat protein [Streptomyces bicolor]|uniref:tetratricopeptide repeat protein n=1 Tax=Streptomyces bicolor TaxID=66874 RepID=UPI0004E12E0D|nr:tetratricopeptide repeat protein [Streptomyces bicolor]
MSRLSRAKKREQKRAAASAAPAAAPIDVRVPAVGPGASGASIGGVPVAAAPGEEIQHVVLTHLQRIALASGHPVHATVHDERIGYVVPLLVDADGSSRFTADPVRTAPPVERTVPSAERTASPGEQALPGDADAVRHPVVPPASSMPPASPVQSASETPPAPPAPDATPYRDRPTHVLRPLQDPSQDAPPTFRMRTLSGPVQDRVPGTVAPPLGEFGPPPPMDARPLPTDVPQADVPPVGMPIPGGPTPGVPRVDQAPDHVREPTPLPARDSTPARDSAPARHSAPERDPLLLSEPDPDPTPPPRGFDAVAEAVLGDGRPAPTADASPFAEQVARIHEAVTAGRTTEAAELAERAVAEASAVLGQAHAEVLWIRELAAYIAYLTGDPVQAFRLSLEVSRTHHRIGDADAAYGSLHGAATAWRAVRDPALGLDLGRELLGLWTEQLATEGGPAAADIEELESARARMDRLATRAAKSAEPPVD